MYGIISIVRKSKSTRKPKMIGYIFSDVEEAENYIKRYREKYVYTTTDFMIVQLSPIAEYKMELVAKEPTLTKNTLDDFYGKSCYFDTDTVSFPS